MNLTRLTLIAALAFGGATVASIAPATAFGQAGVPLTDNNAALQYWQGFGLMTQATKDRLADIEGVKFEGDVLADVRDGNPRLDYLHAGAGMPRCDWGLDFRKGPNTLMPHLNESVTLARLGLLRARYRFEQARPGDAVGDALAVLELAKDVGETPVLISVLVRYGLENLTIETLGRHLPAIDRATLDRLDKELASMPSSDALKRVWPTEVKYFVDWSIQRLAEIEKSAGGDEAKYQDAVLNMGMYSEQEKQKARDVGVPPPAKLRESFERIRGLMEEMAKATDLRPGDQDARLAELVEPFQDDPFDRLIVPDQSKVFQSRRRWKARHALLKAAVAVQREGEEALKDKRYADPFGDGQPFTHRKTAGGFELESKLMYEGNPVILVVGPEKK